MRIPYHTASPTGRVQQQFEDYYRQQQLGGGLPYFVGGKQRGHGIGSFFAGLFRNAIPLIKRGLGLFGKTALNTGLDMATDVIRGGKTVKESAQDRLPEGIKSFASQIPLIHQSGSGVRRSRKRKGRHLSAGNPVKRRKTRGRSSKRKKPATRRKKQHRLDYFS